MLLKKINLTKLQLLEDSLFLRNWHNIQFDQLGVILSINNLPNDDFYNNFYFHLFHKYSNYLDLDVSWLKNKEDTANAIDKELHDLKEVLSFGCGIGYVEKKLLDINTNINLDVYDFSNIAGKWMDKKSRRIKFINKIQNSKKYDAIYLCQVLYALPFIDGIALIANLANYLNHNGKIILINSTLDIYNKELKQDYIFMLYLKFFLRKTKTVFIKIFGTTKYQLWGWQRMSQRYIDMSIQADMNIVGMYSAAQQFFIVLSKKYGQ